MSEELEILEQIHNGTFTKHEILTDDEEKLLSEKISKDIHSKLIECMDKFLSYDYVQIVKNNNDNNDNNDIFIRCFANIDTINKIWEKNHLYVKPYEKTKKMVNSKKDLFAFKVEMPPIIYFGDESYLCFDNGRHRFSNIRDNSEVKYIPIIIPKCDEYKFIKNNIIIENDKKIYFKYVYD